jgi:ABC-2 type transport system permease protein
VAGDREAGVFEYLLSLPISLGARFWGRVFGRFFVVFLPVFLAMAGAVAWGAAQGAEMPWTLFGYYTGLLMALAWCFLGLGMLLSTLARSADVAQGAAFVVWLTLLLFLDLILLGVMVREQLPPETAVAIALANPILYMVNAFRFGMLGASDVSITVAFAIIIVALIGLFATVMTLLHKGIGTRV